MYIMYNEMFRVLIRFNLNRYSVHEWDWSAETAYLAISQGFMLNHEQSRVLGSR